MVFLLSGGSRPLKPTYENALRPLGHDSRAAYPADGADAVWDDCGALLLTGGVDIHPARFGASLLPNGSEEIDLDRDDHEFRLFAGALERKLPVYGICRGLQVINIALGGDIWQDLPSQCALRHNQDDATPLWHDIVWQNGRTEQVNSYHHQAVRRLGQGLLALAHSEDGLTEALCHKDLPIAAVQWHPELMEGGMAALLALLSLPA